MTSVKDIYLPCPYGEGQYGSHRVTPPDEFPCSGIRAGDEHLIALSSWLYWLTQQDVLLRDHVEYEVDRIDDNVYALIRGDDD